MDELHRHNQNLVGTLHATSLETRLQEVRHPEPTAAVVDSQSVKTTAKRW
ncbi:MAG: hypothetical protein MGF17_04940 [Trichodesmium sp. MAG_R04]|nr:hypothetical protein [Trichodesmium sp. MAG_R04]